MLSRWCLDVFGDPCIASSELLGACGDPLVSPFDREADNPLIMTRHDVDHQILTPKVDIPSFALCRSRICPRE